MAKCYGLRGSGLKFSTVLPGGTCGFVSKGDSRRIIRLLEQEVRIGCWPHVEFDWTDAVRTARELRAEHSLKMVVRTMDLFHVAMPIEIGADALVRRPGLL
jgi:hypothetical protein